MHTMYSMFNKVDLRKESFCTSEYNLLCQFALMEDYILAEESKTS